MVPDRRKCNLPNYPLDGAKVIVTLWCKFHMDGAACHLVVHIEKDKLELQDTSPEMADVCYWGVMPHFF